MRSALASTVCMLAAAVVLAGQAVEPNRAQKADPVEEFRRSDPARLSSTGRPQLVEFFHPT